MIYFYFTVNSPLKYDYFKNLGNLHGNVTKNLTWELEHCYYAKELFELQLQTQGTFRIAIGILGYGIDFKIYKNDHDLWR